VTALALAAGAGCGFGVVLVILGVRGTVSKPHRPSSMRTGGREAALRRLGIAAGVALVVGVATRWPVGGLLAGVLVASWRSLFGQKAAMAVQIERIEAIAAWTEMLRDTMAAAAGLEQAITATAAVAPMRIRGEVRALRARLDSREFTLSEALTAFADDLADPTADLVVSALVLAAERRARNLGSLLGALARSARENAAMRMRVEAGRAGVRTSARIITVFSVVLAGILAILQHKFLAPYDTAQGQLVLAFVGCVFGLGFYWLSKMSRYSDPERFLTGLRTETEAVR
jgi:Flp pilus assembly protein TadB